VFSIHFPETPDQAILVTDTQGRMHPRNFVTGVIGEHYGLSILVRSPEDPGSSYRKIKAILQQFDTEVGRTEVVLTDENDVERTYRINAITRTSAAIPAGNDGTRYFYSGNVIASIELVAAETGTGS
jgi:hypothetical protein